jgi:hypothetical protein
MLHQWIFLSQFFKATKLHCSVGIQLSIHRVSSPIRMKSSGTPHSKPCTLHVGYLWYSSHSVWTESLHSTSLISQTETSVMIGPAEQDGPIGQITWASRLWHPRQYFLGSLEGDLSLRILVVYYMLWNAAGCSKSCEIQRLQDQQVAGCSYFLDVRRLKLMYTLVYLAKSLTDVSI